MSDTELPRSSGPTGTGPASTNPPSSGPTASDYVLLLSVIVQNSLAGLIPGAPPERHRKLAAAFMATLTRSMSANAVEMQEILDDLQEKAGRARFEPPAAAVAASNIPTFEGAPVPGN